MKEGNQLLQEADKLAKKCKEELESIGRVSEMKLQMPP